MRPSRVSPRPPGFSLIELLVVLAIVGILAIAGMTGFGSNSPRAVRTQLIDLRGTFHQARDLALASNRDVLIVLDTSASASKPVASIWFADDIATAGKQPIQQSTYGTTLGRYDNLSFVSPMLASASPNETTLAPTLTVLGFTAWNQPLPVKSGSTMPTLLYGFAANGAPIVQNGAARNSLAGGFWIGVTGVGKNSQGVPYGFVIAGQTGLVSTYYKSDSLRNDTAEFTWKKLD